MAGRRVAMALVLEKASPQVMSSQLRHGAADAERRSVPNALQPRRIRGAHASPFHTVPCLRAMASPNAVRPKTQPTRPSVKYAQYAGES